MTYVKINGALYPAAITGKLSDHNWDGRDSKAITLEMTWAEAVETFGHNTAWSIVCEGPGTVPQLDSDGSPVMDESGQPVMVEGVVSEEFDNSEYCVAGDVTDHRDGTVTVKMGRLTELEEAYEIMLGGVE